MLNYHGKPQRDYLFDLLGNFCTHVFTSCRKEQNIPPTLNPLIDNFPVTGPLNGILTAFSHQPQSAWLIVAVDMPNVNAGVIELLISNRAEQKTATCFFNDETQQPEPLLTLWEAHAYPLLLAFAESGNVSPREFLKSHPVNLVDPPDSETLLNYNYPSERT